VLDATRHDDELTFLDPFVTVTKFHAETAFDDQEHFIFMLVMVEDEFALQLVELDVLAVKFGGDVGLPVFGDPGELFSDVDLVHVWSDGRKAGQVAKKVAQTRSPGRCRPGLSFGELVTSRESQWRDVQRAASGARRVYC